jgi:hypothetical protein
MSALIEDEKQYLSSAEEEIVRYQRNSLKKQERKKKRKLKQQKATQQLNNQPIDLTLPIIITNNNKRTKREEKEEEAEEAEEKEEEKKQYSLNPWINKSEVTTKNPYILKTIGEIIKDHEHLGNDDNGLPLDPRARSRLNNNNNNNITIKQEEEEEQQQTDIAIFIGNSQITTKRLTAAELIRNRLQKTSISSTTSQYHEYQLQQIPEESSEYNYLLNQLKQRYPEYYSSLDYLHIGEYTTKLLNHELNSKPRINLHIRTAEFESLLLQQGGKFRERGGGKFVYYPLCIFKQDCQAYIKYKELKLDEPIILMSSFNSIEDYNSFINNISLQTYYLNNNGIEWENDEKDHYKIQPCVLCHRYTTSLLIQAHRLDTCMGHSTPLQQPIAAVEYSGSHYYDIENNLGIQIYYNLMDQEDGYYSEFMITQGSRDCIVQPIVSANLDRLYGKIHSNNGRRYIDQSRLIYQPPATAMNLVPSPEIGIKMSNFLSNNKHSLPQDHRYNYDCNQFKSMILCLLLSFRPLCILNPIIKIYNGQYWIDRCTCESNISNPYIPSLLSLICTEISDALLLSGGGVSADRFIPWTSIQFHSICTNTLLPYCLGKHIQNAAFFYPLAEVSVPLAHLITKCIANPRCQCRESPVMIRKILIRRTTIKTKRGNSGSNKKPKTIEFNDEVLQICKKLILCLYLGNYEELSTTRPSSLFIRRILYDIFASVSKRYDPWVVRLLFHCESVIKYAIRIYMIYSLEHNPAVLNVIDKTIQYNEFKLITLKGVKHLQLVMYSLIEDRSSCFHHCLSTVPKERCNNQHLYYCGHKECQLSSICIKKSKTMIPIEHNYIHFNDIQRDTETSWNIKLKHAVHSLIEDQTMKDLEVNLKHISYRRPNINMSKLLKPQRKLFPLISHPYLQRYTMKEETKEKQEPEIIMLQDLLFSSSSSSSSSSITSTTNSSSNIRPKRKGEKKEKEAEEEEYEIEREQDNYLFPKNSADKYLNPMQLDALHQIINHCGPVGFGCPIQRILNSLPCFGISMEHSIYIKRLLESYRYQLIPTQTIKRALWILRLIDPHAYNLLQLISEFLEQSQRRFKLTDLPLHITLSQIDALRESNDLVNHNDWLLDSSISFVFCPVCYHIYSQIRDHNSVYKNSYEYGLRDALVSYNSDITSVVYCKSNKQNSRGKCGEKELVRIPMIGKMLWFRLKTIMICPQSNCGVLFAFDAKEEKYMTYTERGPSCPSCTENFRNPKNKKRKKNILEEYYVNNPNNPIQCYYCQESLTEPSKTFMYGSHLYLCGLHHSKELKQAVIDATKHIPIENLEDRNVMIKNLLESRKPLTNQQILERAESISVTFTSSSSQYSIP